MLRKILGYLIFISPMLGIITLAITDIGFIATLIVMTIVLFAVVIMLSGLWIAEG